MDGLAGVILTVGTGFIVTVTFPVLVHPFASVPVTVYGVVAGGVEVTVATVVAESPVPGDHAYAFAPLTVIAIFPPGQTEGVGGLKLNAGGVYRFTSAVAVAVQPLGPVPVTV